MNDETAEKLHLITSGVLSWLLIEQKKESIKWYAENKNSEKLLTLIQSSQLRIPDKRIRIVFVLLISKQVIKLSFLSDPILSQPINEPSREAQFEYYQCHPFALKSKKAHLFLNKFTHSLPINLLYLRITKIQSSKDQVI